MGLLYSISVRLMNFMVFFLIVIMLPGLPPRTTFPFKEFDITPAKELKGVFEPNNLLDGAERLLEGRVYGPEHLLARGKEIYMGIHGGEVIKISGDHVTHVTKLGQPCEEIFEESRCGRPLGLAFDTKGNNLIVADAYYGIWEVDLNSLKKKLLVSPQQELPGKDVDRKAKFFNSVAVDQRGDIYWTDSSSDVTLQDLVYTAFANPSGRLFKYNRATNESQVLLDELYFPNGLVLSPNEDFIVVAETGAMRLLKYNLKGAKAGESEVFFDGLPGLPDNLTPDAEGIWVPLVMAVDSQHPNGYVVFSTFPSARLFLARMLNILELPFKLLNDFYPHKLFERFIHFIGHGESMTLLSPKRTTIVRIDWQGNAKGSLHGFDKTLSGISHVLEIDGELLLGSPFNRYLGRVKLPNSPKVRVQNVRYEGAKMEPIVANELKSKQKPATTTTTAKPTTTTTTTTTTPKPTTTTPKPTTTTTTTTTTTPKPTTAKPATTAKPTTTTTTTAKPKPAANEKRIPPKKPAAVREDIPHDTKPPQQEKLKVLDKHGKHVEL